MHKVSFELLVGETSWGTIVSFSLNRVFSFIKPFLFFLSGVLSVVSVVVSSVCF